MKKEQASSEIELTLKNMFDENQRKMQSQMDKFHSNIEKVTKVA